MKFKIFLLPLVFLVVIIGVYGVCCEQYKNSEGNINYCIEENDASKCSGATSELSCEQTDFCKPICCITGNGCNANVPRARCIAENGIVDENSNCKVDNERLPQCVEGCCNIKGIDCSVGGYFYCQERSVAFGEDFKADFDFFIPELINNDECESKCNEGCCYYAENVCDVVTKGDCERNKGDFIGGYCSEYARCGITAEVDTICWGDGNVHWRNSQGVSEEEKENCVNRGKICRQEPGEDAKCVNVNCEDHKEGESWCVSSKAYVVNEKNDKAYFDFGDSPYRIFCDNGEMRAEQCKTPDDVKGVVRIGQASICVEEDNKAKCVDNIVDECGKCKPVNDLCVNEDEEVCISCKIENKWSDRDDLKVCVPEYKPGIPGVSQDDGVCDEKCEDVDFVEGCFEEGKFKKINFSEGLKKVDIIGGTYNVLFSLRSPLEPKQDQPYTVGNTDAKENIRYMIDNDKYSVTAYQTEEAGRSCGHIVAVIKFEFEKEHVFNGISILPHFINTGSKGDPPYRGRLQVNKITVDGEEVLLEGEPIKSKWGQCDFVKEEENDAFGADGNKHEDDSEYTAFHDKGFANIDNGVLKFCEKAGKVLEVTVTNPYRSDHDAKFDAGIFGDLVALGCSLFHDPWTCGTSFLLEFAEQYTAGDANYEGMVMDIYSYVNEQQNKPEEQREKIESGDWKFCVKGDTKKPENFGCYDKCLSGFEEKIGGLTEDACKYIDSVYRDALNSGEEIPSSGTTTEAILTTRAVYDWGEVSDREFILTLMRIATRKSLEKNREGKPDTYMIGISEVEIFEDPKCGDKECVLEGDCLYNKAKETCEAEKAPVSGDCNLCNLFEFNKENYCDEYFCASLGKNCKFNEHYSACFDVNDHDAPEFVKVNRKVPEGNSINLGDDIDYSTFELNVETDESAICKLEVFNINIGEVEEFEVGFDDMTNDFNDGRAVITHTFDFRDKEGKPMLNKESAYIVHVSCIDLSLEKHESDVLKVYFNTGKGPDIGRPIIAVTEKETYVEGDVYNLKFYVKEESEFECRYSKESDEFNEMSAVACASEKVGVGSIIYADYYSCSKEVDVKDLSLNDELTIYLVCKDSQGLIGENSIKVIKSLLGEPVISVVYRETSEIPTELIVLTGDVMAECRWDTESSKSFEDFKEKFVSDNGIEHKATISTNSLFVICRSINMKNIHMRKYTFI